MTTGALPPQAPAGAPAPAGGANPLLQILQVAVRAGAADIHLKAHLPPKAVIDGKVKVLPGMDNFILDPRILPQMIFALLPPEMLQQFKTDKEIDTAFDIPGLARFRANVFMNLGTVSAVLRIIQNDIRSTDDLGLPPVLKKIALEKQGLVLVTGPTGSGKSTTLGAVINFINETLHGHLVSIEDPIELVHPHKHCIISQREVGKDTNNFARALKSALRQAPNVILIGELRDRETIELALKGAETGHLVLSTLHTNDAVQTINRMLNAFPPNEQESVRLTIANVLKCCIAQRLVVRSDGKGRVPVLDMLVQTGAVRECIIKGKLDELYGLIQNGGFDGMQSTNQALMNHYRAGVVDFSTCMATAEDKQGMMMALRSEMRTIKEAADEILREKRRNAPPPPPAAEPEPEMRERRGLEGPVDAIDNLQQVRVRREGTGQLDPNQAPPRPGTGQLDPNGPPRPGTGQLRQPPPGGPPKPAGSGPLRPGAPPPKK
jgi:twitching motility protein PilT